MHSCKLSEVTKEYLIKFDCIFENMQEKMTTAQLTDSISHNFIVQMLPHHRAAIEMSENILRYTTNIEIQEIASNIITQQSESIRNMQEILDTCSCLGNTEQDDCLYQKRTSQILETMFCGMRTAYADNCINCNFLREMLPHHKGAVEMSENALRFPICPELVPILDAIITSQEKGIREMQRLLCCFSCKR